MRLLWWSRLSTNKRQITEAFPWTFIGYVAPNLNKARRPVYIIPARMIRFTNNEKLDSVKRMSIMHSIQFFSMLSFNGYWIRSGFSYRPICIFTYLRSTITVNYSTAASTLTVPTSFHNPSLWAISIGVYHTSPSLRSPYPQYGDTSITQYGYKKKKELGIPTIKEKT